MPKNIWSEKVLKNKKHFLCKNKTNIKKIYYDKKGFITKIEERDGDENSPFGWGPETQE